MGAPPACDLDIPHVTPISREVPKSKTKAKEGDLQQLPDLH